MKEIIKSIDGVELDCIKKTNPNEKGKVLLVHGITVDLHEGGMYDRLSDKLFEDGYSTLQFSFRGHGNSKGTQEGMTISGEILDLLSAIRYFQDYKNERINIIASSFGAVSTCILIDTTSLKIKNLILWNPVLDLNDTFLSPTLSWGLLNFSKKRRKAFENQDFIFIDETFKVGKILFTEFNYYNPQMNLINSQVDTLIIHGNKDSYVSYSTSKKISEASQRIKLITVENSDHGFDSQENEDYAINCTIEWLKKKER